MSIYLGGGSYPGLRDDMNIKKEERRKYPRIKDKEISVKLSGEGFEAITKSLNISASGIYCKLTSRLPLMSRVEIHISLPKKIKSASPVTLDIDGVVVREEPFIKDGRVVHYDVAIFFDSLSPIDREKLIRYIDINRED